MQKPRRLRGLEPHATWKPAMQASHLVVKPGTLYIIKLPGYGVFMLRTYKMLKMVKFLTNL